MSTEVNLNEVKINLLTREQYNSIANKNSNEIYMVIDDNEGLSLVAYSGSYNDLKDTPNFAGLEARIAALEAKTSQN